jgi:hypothetical protein
VGRLLGLNCTKYQMGRDMDDKTIQDVLCNRRRLGRLVVVSFVCVLFAIITLLAFGFTDLPGRESIRSLLQNVFFNVALYVVIAILGGVWWRNCRCPRCDRLISVWSSQPSCKSCGTSFAKKDAG